MKIRRILHILLFFLLVTTSYAQRSYECWIDDNYDSRMVGTQPTDNDFSLSVDIGTLSSGIHLFNYHVQDLQGGWGPLYRKFFLKSSAEIIGYEYWFDDDVANKITANASGNELSLPISITQLKGGVHYLNIRTKHADGTWGTLMRKGFEVVQTITGYQYAFGTDTARTTVPIEPTSLLEMQNQRFDIPEPSVRTAISDSTAFKIDSIGHTALLVSNDTTDFTIAFRNDEGCYSEIQTTEVAVIDSLQRDLPEIPLFGNLQLDKVTTGDFRGFRINVDEDDTYKLWANQDARLMLLERDGYRILLSDSTSLRKAYELQLHAGRYYGIIYDTKTDSVNADDSIIVTYSLKNNIVATPVISHVGNHVEISTATSQATIYYTIDGTTPDKTSMVYQDSITVERNCTIKAIAYRENYNPSQITTFVVDWIVIGDAKFDGLVATISGERALDEAFEQSGGRNEAAKTIAAVVWNKETALTEDMLQGLDNPNLLIYVNDASLVPENHNNVVVNGVAKSILLTDTKSGNGNFFAPQPFVAESISYTRNFEQQTQIGVCRGWETIALPFDVQSVKHELQGDIAPFGSSVSDKHFWLRRLLPDGLQQDTQIEANTPYVISMPNSEEYVTEYNLPGRVTFSSANITVPATEPKIQSLANSSIEMVPTTVAVARSPEVWALNVGQAHDGYPEGSVFVRDYREVRPFEAYVVHQVVISDNDNPSPQLVSIQKLMGQVATGIQQVEERQMAADGLKWLGDGWWTLDGRKLQGKPTKKGIYIRNGCKQVIP